MDNNHGYYSQVGGLAICAASLLNVLSFEHELLPHASYSLSFVASSSLAICLLQPEQRGLIRPSDSVTLYLLGSVLCDSVALTIPSATLSPPPPSRCLLSIFLLMLQSFAKSKAVSSENESGVLDRLFFIWINPLLLRGYKGPLPLLSHDIPKLDQDLSQKLSRESMVKAWNGRGRARF